MMTLAGAAKAEATQVITCTVTRKLKDHTRLLPY